MIDFVPQLAALFMPVLAAASVWYAAPLVVSVTLVVAATRHESMGPILRHAARFAVWVLGFMAAFAALVIFLDWQS